MPLFGIFRITMFTFVWYMLGEGSGSVLLLGGIFFAGFVGTGFMHMKAIGIFIWKHIDQLKKDVQIVSGFGIVSSKKIVLCNKQKTFCKCFSNMLLQKGFQKTQKDKKIGKKVFLRDFTLTRRK